jgi:hypothetical protein
MQATAPDPARPPRAPNLGFPYYFHFPRDFREKGYSSALSALPGGVSLRFSVNCHKTPPVAEPSATIAHPKFCRVSFQFWRALTLFRAARVGHFFGWY